MSAPTEDAVGRINRALRESEERDVEHMSLNVDESDLRAVLARLEVAEKDARRLDWVEANKPGFALIADIGGPWQVEITVGERDECESWEAPTYRAALDHAMRGGA